MKNTALFVKAEWLLLLFFKKIGSIKVGKFESKIKIEGAKAPSIKIVKQPRLAVFVFSCISIMQEMLRLK